MSVIEYIEFCCNGKSFPKFFSGPFSCHDGKIHHLVRWYCQLETSIYRRVSIVMGDPQKSGSFGIENPRKCGWWVGASPYDLGNLHNMYREVQVCHVWGRRRVSFCVTHVSESCRVEPPTIIKQSTHVGCISYGCIWKWAIPWYTTLKAFNYAGKMMLQRWVLGLH